MKTAFGQPLAFLVLVAAALFGLACDKVKSPTEPVGANIGPTPTPRPTPTPTPIPQPASLSGKVTWLYGGGPIAGASVSCQGGSAITSSDGTYSLTGLMSGKTSVTVTVNLPPIESTDFSIELKPGPNTVDLAVL